MSANRERIAEFLTLKAEVTEREAKMRDIRQYFADNLGIIAEALGLEERVLLENLDATTAGKVCEKTRPTKRCDWATLARVYPEAYEACVTEEEITYIEIRKVARSNRVVPTREPVNETGVNASRDA